MGLFDSNVSLGGMIVDRSSAANKDSYLIKEGFRLAHSAIDVPVVINVLRKGDV